MEEHFNEPVKNLEEAKRFLEHKFDNEKYSYKIVAVSDNGMVFSRTWDNLLYMYSFESMFNLFGIGIEE